MKIQPGLGLRHTAGRALLGLCTVLVATLGGSACGYRTDPRPPEATAAVIPGAVTATKTNAGVALQWPRATHSADGRRLDDLQAFVVERADGDGPFQAVGAVQVSDNDRIQRRRDFEFLDEQAPATALRYRVRARTADGQVGPATLPAPLGLPAASTGTVTGQHRAAAAGNGAASSDGNNDSGN